MPKKGQKCIYGGKSILMNEVIRSRYPEEGPAKLASEFGVSKRNIMTRATRMGIKSLNKAKKTRGHRSNIKSVDFDYFAGSWSPNMAWLIGYIFADGSVSKNGKRGLVLGFSTVESDGYLLEQVREELKSCHKIIHNAGRILRKKNGAVYQCQPQVSLNVTNSKLCSDLMSRFGVNHRKSYHDYPFPSIPHEYFTYFVRGFFDGDGCVYIHKNGCCRVSVVGTFKFIQSMQKRVCRVLGISENGIDKHKLDEVYRTAWAANKDIVKLYRWLYPEPDLCRFLLKRKKDKFEEKMRLLQNKYPEILKVA